MSERFKWFYIIILSVTIGVSHYVDYQMDKELAQENFKAEQTRISDKINQGLYTEAAW